MEKDMEGRRIRAFSKFRMFTSEVKFQAERTFVGQRKTHWSEVKIPTKI